jgi:putative proteasome-type protease
MTYCVGIAVNDGLVFCSDSRTNVGVDQISTYSKMFRWGIEGERQFVILCAGNLATTQAVLSQVSRDIDQGAVTSLANIGGMKDAADYLGEISQVEQQKHSSAGARFEASFIIGGQIGSRKPRVVLVYPEGNHISTSSDTPFLQIGESKYGKPILDRILTPTTSLDTCAMCAMVSMDSTLRSNLTVGPPIEVLVYTKDSLIIDQLHRFEQDSDFLREISRSWDQRLKEAFRQMPPLTWAANWDQRQESKNNDDQ